jgi:hypothetical protein
VSCRAARKQIPLWVGYDLSQSAVESLELHIENCPECQEYAEVLLSSSEVLLAFNSETARPSSDSVWDGVRLKIKGDRQCESRRSLHLSAGLLVAAMLLLLAVLPDFFATVPVRAIPVSDAPPSFVPPSGYSPFYPDSSWRKLESLEGPAAGRPVARNAAFSF